MRLSSQAGEGVRAGFEERGEEERKKIEQELIKRRSAARERGEAECPDMINMASTDVVEGTMSDEFCKEFFFFTANLENEERRKRKRIGLI